MDQDTEAQVPFVPRFEVINYITFFKSLYKPIIYLVSFGPFITWR